MKTLFLALMIFSSSVFAFNVGDLQSQSAKLTEQAKAKAQDVMAACKDDKIKYCDKYTEINALKECLKLNQANLSAPCKASLGLK